MSRKVERYQWLNMIVGILDQAFNLTDEEQFFVIDIVSRLLESLVIPERGTPDLIAPQLALEVSSGMYSNQLAGPRSSGLERPIRSAGHGDSVVSIEAWCEALLGLVLVSYPDLSPVERLVSAKVFSDMLDGIGVPQRVASFFPDDVVRIANHVDA